jgi:uncharacterized protein DUF4185
MARRVVYVTGSTSKVCQVTGEYDPELKRYTANRTESSYGLRGTDLGNSFEHNGKIFFLFGDSIPTHPHEIYRPPAGDAIGFTTTMSPGNCLPLKFVTAPDGDYLSPSVPGISLAGYEVPTHGFSLHGSMYVFFTTGHTQTVGMGRSILARSDDEGQTFHHLYDLSDRLSEGKFINVATAIARNINGIPERDILLLWGSGKYRGSNPYLAYLPLDDVETRSALRYYAGKKAHHPIWSPHETDAVPLFQHPCIGELSVTWNPFLHNWLMLYNGHKPDGINFHVASAPWGDWSDPDVLFDPYKDSGYCNFIYLPPIPELPATHCPHLSDEMFGRSRLGERGDAYGPYVISPYTQGEDSKRTTIYFLMSTWNPYNTVLMKSTLEITDAIVAEPLERGLWSYLSQRIVDALTALTKVMAYIKRRVISVAARIFRMT